MIADSQVKLAMMVAVGGNGAIGLGGRLPWHLPADLRHFRQVTRGHAVVMGRRTFEEIGRPLPGRPTFVVSARLAAAAPPAGVEVRASLEGALAAAADTEAARWAAGAVDRACVFLLGGPSLWLAAWPAVDEAWITEVDLAPAADTYLPPLDRAPFVWRELGVDPGPPALRFVCGERRA